MWLVVFSHYLNFHGHKGARLTCDQTIYGHQPQRTHLIKTLSIFFFYAPESYLRGMHGHHVVCLYTETLSNRAGIHPHGCRHLSAQMGRIYHKAAVWVDRIHPICEYHQLVHCSETRIPFS